MKKARPVPFQYPSQRERRSQIAGAFKRQRFPSYVGQAQEGTDICIRLCLKAQDALPSLLGQLFGEFARVGFGAPDAQGLNAEDRDHTALRFVCVHRH